MGNIFLPPGVQLPAPANADPDKFTVEIEQAGDRIGWNIQLTAFHRGRKIASSPVNLAIGWGAAIDRAHAELEQLRTSWGE